MTKRMMKWIKSAGGPLICLDEIWAGCWRGVSASSELEPSEATTDYERACATEDYVAELATDGGRALILGDMPLETSVWSGQNTTIIRLFYADARTDFGDLVEKIGNEVFQNPIESTRYQIASGRMVIFDSALDGRDHGRNLLTFDIESGPYEILTATAKPDNRTSLLLHRFFRLN